MTDKMTDYHLVIDGATAEESWHYLEDDAPLNDAPAIISLARLKAEADSLRDREAPLGVRLNADGLGKTDLGEDVRELGTLCRYAGFGRHSLPDLSQWPWLFSRPRLA